MAHRAPYILLVDDNPADAKLNQIAIERVAPELRIIHVWSGPDAIRFLEKVKHKTNWPAVMLVDFNMPEMTGGELIQILTDRKLNQFPIYIFSGMISLPSDDPLLVKGARACLEKPLTYLRTEELFAELLGMYTPQKVVSA
ncbi:MAG: response regulator [Bacteroidota bacterium]